MSNYYNEASRDRISRSIQQKLDEISSNNTKNQFIFRIDNTLWETSKAAYEPEMVSIGPYHRGKNKLQEMEKYKLKYLQGILQRQNETSAGRYIDSLLKDEEKARSYYADAEHLMLGGEAFVEMMLLDGCFIIEFMRKYKKKNDDLARLDDPIFKMEWILEIIRRDLLLLENQIPFFILVKLFDMTKTKTKIKISSNNPTVAAAADDDLISLAVSCLTDVITKSENKKIQSEDVLHLLGLMYESWCSSFAQSIYDDKKTEGSISNGNNKSPPKFSCINFGRKNRQADDEEDIMCIKSVTELNQDGIKFVKAAQSTSWLDIKFEDGEIKIPPLFIRDSTKCILKNLIAYEQYTMFDSRYGGKFVTDYTTFMNCLINTPMDVQKLRVTGIIRNLLGCDEEITGLFNNISKNVFLSTGDFSYRKHFKNVNKHCNQRRSDLKKTYFNNPWLIILLLLLLFYLFLH